jgi:NAD(P)-dependent dehydrogenase (short-subunit alcohol dehydrogenase family)
MESTTAGKVCLITGATSGIGLVTARELAQQGFQVVLVGRNPDRCAAAAAQIQKQTTAGQVEVLQADLSSQQQIRDLAEQFKKRHARLDVLINNAGGLWMRRQLSVDGVEMTFAVNHLAYFLLTHLLLDTLRASALARIINVASDAHQRAALDFDNLQGERSYGGWRAYCRSKLANLLFTYELDRRIRGTGLTVNAVHPGWVATGFAGNNGWRGWVLQQAARRFALTPEEGARTLIYLAASPDVAGVSGRYFVREQAVASSPASYDEAAARRLWEVSATLTHVV